MNRSRKFRGPYLLTASSVEKPIPFMVPFVNFTNVTLPNGKTVPEYGLVHPDFSSRDFTYNGASYDTSSGVLTGFSASSSRDVGKLADMSFTRKRNKHCPQPLLECYFVEWAPDGCLPGLNILMKGWDMRRLKMSTTPWLKLKKFPVNHDQKYLQSIDIIGQGPKTYLVPKGVSIESIEIMSVPFAHIFKSVKENVKSELQSYGIKYEESTGIFQGSAGYERYSKLYSTSTHSSAISGVEFKVFRVRFRNSFNFKAGTSWDDEFRNEFQDLWKSQNKDQAIDFYKEYGTHYIREAEMGGRKESLLGVSYCDFEEDEKKKAEFKAKLLIPYETGLHSVSPSFYYQNNLSESDRKAIISGPVTTCRGGDTVNKDVCVNDSRWHPTVLNRPYPTTLLLEPFHKLPNNLSTQQWLEERYHEYLLVDLEETELEKDLQTEAYCSGILLYVGSRISVFLAVSLVFMWLLHFE